MFCLRIVLLLFLAAGTLADDGFDLFDALDPDPTTAKPKVPKETPGKPKSDGELDLLDAFGLDPTPAKPDVPKVPEKPKPDGGGLDLSDALGPDPEPAKPKDPKVPVKPGTGGKELSDSDLFDITGDYKPDGGRSGGAGAGGGGGAQDPGYNPQGGGGGDQPQDPDLLWGQILKMLNANMPEEFYMWISNVKQMLTPLVERAMDLLQAMP